jgi:hypothetical protein
MNRGLPPTVRAPARADLLRGTFAERSAHVTLGDTGDLSLTVTIEDHSPAQGRRFAFRAAREADRGARPRPDREPDPEQAFLVTDERPNSREILDHADMRSSAPFLAGAIAQMRPGPLLRNPSCREAAGAYRRSDCLGAVGSRLGFRSDKRV